MIIDLGKFVASEQAYWKELETQLDQLDKKKGYSAPLTLPQIERMHYLYQRAASDLARLATFSAEGDLRRSLGALVGRAYSEMHSATGLRANRDRYWLWHWLTGTFPRTFRRHAQVFWVVVALTLLGAAFGAVAVAIDPEAKSVILPTAFAPLQGNPADRVADEEKTGGTHMNGHQATFSSFLMTNNIKVSILSLALGFTWGIGTVISTFYNAVILGAIIYDYLHAGQGVFLTGWLLPHGSFEIPAFLIASQAGLLIGHALTGRGQGVPLRERLRAVRADVVTLICGVAVMLVWAGFIEAFFSQYHAPVLPYWLKISFGCVELAALVAFLGFAGRKTENG